MKKFVLLIEDDFELLGNGQGNVASLQYLPALAFMNILDNHGIKVSFMVDAAQQIFFAKQLAPGRNITAQCRLWEETVSTMVERGHDVQLHIHPQWLDARIDGDHVVMGPHWNLGSYAPDRQRELVEGSVGYLHRLLRPIDPHYTVVGYKAGQWGMQPSEALMRILSENGVRIVMGARDGMFIPRNDVDFRSMEEPHLPYHPDPVNLTRLAEGPTPLTMLPMQGYAPGPLALLKLTAAKLWGAQKKLKREMSYYQRGAAPKEVAHSPLDGRHRPKLALRPFLTHLKLGDAPLGYLKASFDAVLDRLSDVQWPRIPIVMESHTKQFPGYYADIDRFLDYVTTRYAKDVEFGTVRSIAAELQSRPELVCSHENRARTAHATASPAALTAQPQAGLMAVDPLQERGRTG